MMYASKILCAGLIGLILSGCSNSDSSDSSGSVASSVETVKPTSSVSSVSTQSSLSTAAENSSAPSGSVENMLGGNLLAAGEPVEGIEYSTNTLSGITDESGGYDYIEGELVTFYIGDIAVPTIAASAQIALETLSENQAIDGNILYFFNTLDDDADPLNGILIIEQQRDLASGKYVQFDQSFESFVDDGNVQTVLAELSSVTSAGTRTQPLPASQPTDAVVTLRGDDTAVYGTSLTPDSISVVAANETTSSITATLNLTNAVEFSQAGAALIVSVYDEPILDSVLYMIALQINRSGDTYQYYAGGEDRSLFCDRPCTEPPLSIDMTMGTLSLDDTRLDPADGVEGTVQTAPVWVTGTLTWSP